MRKLIGKGSFSKAYQTGENSVELVSTCPTKECYALFSEGNSFAPILERDYQKEDTYKMPLYPKMRAPKQQLNEDGYRVYKALRTLCARNYFDFCEKVNTLDTLSEQEKEEICFLAGDVCNAVDPQDLGFEISPRNITHDEQGNLIMLDCFFCTKTLAQIWNKKLTYR